MMYRRLGSIEILTPSLNLPIKRDKGYCVMHFAPLKPCRSIYLFVLYSNLNLALERTKIFLRRQKEAPRYF